MSLLAPDPDWTAQTVSPVEFDWECRFEREAPRLGFAYWNSRRGERRIPHRDDLDPVAMRSFTQHVGMVDVRIEDGLRYFIRRAGSRWEDVYGPITGRYLEDFLSADLQRCWRHVFDTARLTMSPVRVTTPIDFQQKTWLNAEFLVAPLGRDEQVSMLFIVFAAWTRTDVRPQALPPTSRF